MPMEQINVRIDAETKAQAERVLAEIGLAPSDAVRMLYRQLIMRHGLPFDARGLVPAKKKSARGLDKFEKLVNDSVEKNKVALKNLATR